jgi:ParB-like chromosome segregation protein Spo0J
MIDLVTKYAQLFEDLKELPPDDLIDSLNKLKIALHTLSPMKNEPVDCVIWVKADDVHANDYNPNTVAPIELDLLKLSILSDGYTQPVVVCPDENANYEVVDGFHRTKVCKSVKTVNTRVKGRIPIVLVRDERTVKSDRMASTIRHNRARGKHTIAAMSDIVCDLYKRGWSDEKIATELGMDADEVLRLKQVTGLAEAFADTTFSKAWVPS